MHSCGLVARNYRVWDVWDEAVGSLLNKVPMVFVILPGLRVHGS